MQASIVSDSVEKKSVEKEESDSNADISINESYGRIFEEENIRDDE